MPAHNASEQSFQVCMRVVLVVFLLQLPDVLFVFSVVVPRCPLTMPANSPSRFACVLCWLCFCCNYLMYFLCFRSLFRDARSQCQRTVLPGLHACCVGCVSVAIT